MALQPTFNSAIHHQKDAMKHLYKVSAVLFVLAQAGTPAFASTLDAIETQPVAGQTPVSKAEMQRAHEQHEAKEHSQKLRELTNQIFAEKNAAKKKLLLAQHRALLQANKAETTGSKPSSPASESND